MVDIVQKPLPSPREGQTEQEFVSQCMGNETMRKEYPVQEQRAAVCYSIYRRRNKSDDDLRQEEIYASGSHQDYVPQENVMSESYKIGDIVKFDGKLGKIIKIIE